MSPSMEWDRQRDDEMQNIMFLAVLAALYLPVGQEGQTRWMGGTKQVDRMDRQDGRTGSKAGMNGRGRRTGWTDGMEGWDGWKG